ncbi:hypothetical protein [Okeania sp. SIO2C9]|nr:hypothetical protein [Okeania sp. SIO2C9]
MGRWGDGVMGRWGDGVMGLHIESGYIIDISNNKKSNQLSHSY